MDVLSKVKSSDAYQTRFIKPVLIGPDRGTVKHTMNVMDSYKPSANQNEPSVRPNYRDFVDIVGT